MAAVEPPDAPPSRLRDERNALDRKELQGEFDEAANRLSRPAHDAVRAPGPRAVTVDDSELIQAVLAGRRERFVDLVHRHAAPLWSTIRRHLAHEEDAREALQETWVRAFERLGDVRDPGRLRSWLLSIALNHVRELARRRRPLALVEGEGEEPDPGVAPDDALASADAARAVRAEIEQLPPRQREVFDLRMNHELSHAEVAEHLGITEEASRANYYQALRRLRGRFPADEAPSDGGEA